MKFEKLVEISRALRRKHNKKTHISFILKNHRILAIGINNEKKTHPHNLRYGYINRINSNIRDKVGTHSEVKAIFKFVRFGEITDFNFSKYKLINVRINYNGEVAMSKPCVGCSDFLSKLNFKEIWYTDENGNFKQF